MSTQPDVLTADPVTYTVEQFCNAHRISVAFYYKLKRKNQAPREIEVGTRRLISGEEAARWRAQRAAANQTEQPSA